MHQLTSGRKGFWKFALPAAMLLSLVPQRCIAADNQGKQKERDPLVQILIEKGILTESDADALEAEVARRKKAEATSAPKPADSAAPGKTKVSFKGQYRIRAEGRHNRDFSSVVSDRRGSVIHRARFGVGIDTGDDNEAFVQFQDARVFGTELSPTSSGVFTSGAGATPPTAAGTPNEALDIHQAFWQIKNLRDLPVTARIGRQEFAFGDERLIGSFGWDNVGRAFDGARLTFQRPDHTTDVFLAKVVESRSVLLPPTAAPPTEDADLGGIYVSWPKHLKGATDLYAFYKRDRTAANYANTGTVGVRRRGTLGRSADYFLESAYQFGEVLAGDQSAYAYVGAVGYNVPKSKTGLRFAVEYDFATGDDTPGDGKSGTFDQLYPTNHDKYGYADYQGWRNMRDLRLTVSGKPTTKLWTGVDWHWFGLDSARDSWYGASGMTNGAKYLSAAGAFGRDVGEELDVSFRYAYSQRVSLLAGYSRFLPGDFVKNANGGVDDASDWYFLQSQFDF